MADTAAKKHGQGNESEPIKKGKALRCHRPSSSRPADQASGKKRRYRRRTVDSAENYARIATSHVKDTVSSISRYKVLVEHDYGSSDNSTELKGGDCTSSAPVSPTVRHRQLMRSMKDLSTEQLLTIYHSDEESEERRKAAREMAYLKTIFLVPSTISYMYSIDTETFNDAVQNASLTMLTAMDWFKPELGYSFSHYNLGYFRSAMSRTFRDKNVVDFPSGVLGNRAKGENGVTYKQESYDQQEEDARERKYGGKKSITGSSGYFSEYNDEYAYGMGTDELAYGGASIDDCAGVDEIDDLLYTAISKESGVLTDDEREVLILHAGLFGHKEHHYKEIAELRAKRGLGASCSRISQLNTSAKNKLREWFEINGYGYLAEVL